MREIWVDSREIGEEKKEKEWKGEEEEGERVGEQMTRRNSSCMGPGYGETKIREGFKQLRVALADKK